MSETSFLNIDLDIHSTNDITPIVHFWGDAILVHRLDCINSIWIGSFETWESEENAIINTYYNLVCNLPSELRAVWNQLQKRDFDFGYEGGSPAGAFHSRLTRESITQLAEIKGSITITIYPPNPYESQS